MPDNSPQLISWLNSKAGRKWSYSTHRQSAHAVRWFSFKPGIERPWQAEGRVDGDFDDLLNTVTVDLGWYNASTGRYRTSKRCSQWEQYGKPA